MVEHPPLEREPFVVQEYVKNEFRKKNALDYELYETTRARLAKQLEGLEESKILYKEMLQKVAERCSPEASAKSVEGAFEGDCYWNDNGCAVGCIDGYAKDTNECPCKSIGGIDL